MKAQLKNWLLPIKRSCFLYKKQGAFICLLFFSIITKAQIANFVSNGSFEQLNPSAAAYSWNGSRYWQPMDSINKVAYYLCTTTPSIQNAPNVSTGFQFPRTGNSFAGCQFYCGGSGCNANNSRNYLRNRLKQPLQAGKTYCAKYHIVCTNNNVVAINSYGIYFGNNVLDTISYCHNVITYLNPQVQYTGGIITDTLNWTPITGTFVANGSEKYMVLGNFKSNAATNTLLVNSVSAGMSNDIFIDDVSVIDIDLPAYAGIDIWGTPTTTVYLGRPQDVGIDEACMWYKLPNATTAIDTAAGITVTVAAITNTYMVKQDICGLIKYDTVIVYASGVGVNELIINNEKLKIYPNPANGILNVELEMLNGKNAYKIIIYNSLGQIVREEEISFKDNKAKLKTDDLENGVYVISLQQTQGDNAISVSKRFVIAR